MLLAHYKRHSLGTDLGGLGYLYLSTNEKKENGVLLQYCLVYVCSRFWGKVAIKRVFKLLILRIVLSEVGEMGMLYVSAFMLHSSDPKENQGAKLIV